MAGRQYAQSAPATEEQFSPPAQDGLSLILAAAMRYALAGVALMLLIGAGAWAVGAPARVSGWALIIGGAWAALLMLADFSRDPLAVEWQLWRARQAIARDAAQQAQIEALQAAAESRDAELAQARHAATAWQERAQAGKPNYVPPQPPAQAPEVRDAWQLVRRRYERAEPVSKEYMGIRGWSADRYLAATGVLRERGYYSRNNQWRQFGSTAEALAAFSPAPPVVGSW